MNISITDPNPYKVAVERYNALWKVVIRKRIKMRLIWFLFGIFFVLSGVLEGNGKSKSTKHLPGGDIQEITYFNLNIFLSLGIVILFFGLIDFWTVYREKNKHFYRYCHVGAGSAIKLDLTDETITHEHFGMTSIIQWRLFSYYIDYGGFLFLVMYDSPFNSVTINKNLFSQQQLNELAAFLEEKKIMKKK